jgi:hypothetical protein
MPARDWATPRNVEASPCGDWRWRRRDGRSIGTSASVEHAVPQAVSCRAWHVSQARFSKWKHGQVPLRGKDGVAAAGPDLGPGMTEIPNDEGGPVTPRGGEAGDGPHRVGPGQRRAGIVQPHPPHPGVRTASAGTLLDPSAGPSGGSPGSSTSKHRPAGAPPIRYSAAAREWAARGVTRRAGVRCRPSGVKGRCAIAARRPAARPGPRSRTACAARHRGFQNARHMPAFPPPLIIVRRASTRSTSFVLATLRALHVDRAFTAGALLRYRGNAEICCAA